MGAFKYVDLFETYDSEYLLIIVFFLLLIFFWRTLAVRPKEKQ
jgi:hypothetical protein